MSLAIAGIGTAVPEHSTDQDDALRLARDMCAQNHGQVRTLRAIYNRSGIRKRHSVLHEFTNGSNGNGNGNGSNGASNGDGFYLPERGSGDRGPTTQHRMQRYESEIAPLAVQASNSAIAQSQIETNALTHLVTVSCTGFNAPGFDVALIKQLGLPPGIERTHVGYMGCHGALNGLRVARSFVEANKDATVLLCAAELCTLHLFYGWHTERMVANALFADGAAAMIVVPPRRAAGDSWQVVDNASLVLDETDDMMTWRVGDHGFEMTLSVELPGIIERRLRPWLETWLARNDLSIDAVGSWAIHPGGPKIICSVAGAVGLSDDDIATSQGVLADYGNMSSPTLLFIIDRLRSAEAPRPCVAIGFGPGLTIEAALIR
jgi:predicted naringenin-chalcone synthase